MKSPAIEQLRCVSKFYYYMERNSMQTSHILSSASECTRDSITHNNVVVSNLARISLWDTRISEES